MDGFALDIGGSWARWYHFQESVVVESDRERLEGSGSERIEAICRLLLRHEHQSRQVATACAGRKDKFALEIVASNFGEPMPNLCEVVAQTTGVSLGRLWDDDVSAGWGHLVSPFGGLNDSSPDTLLLTGGTGVAECLWVKGKFLPKGSYPSAAELGLESHLRAEGWRQPEQALAALQKLLKARWEFGIERLVVSGKLAEIPELDFVRLSRTLDLDVERVRLEEAPALGALHLSLPQNCERGYNPA